MQKLMIIIYSSLDEIKLYPILHNINVQYYTVQENEIILINIYFRTNQHDNIVHKVNS